MGPSYDAVYDLDLIYFCKRILLAEDVEDQTVGFENDNKVLSILC